jgi:hypothetical protein
MLTGAGEPDVWPAGCLAVHARSLVPAPARNKPNRSSAAVENGMRGGLGGRRARCNTAQAVWTELALHPTPNA